MPLPQRIVQVEEKNIYGIIDQDIFVPSKFDFFTSGCVLLDCALSGGGREEAGWVENGVINVIGDKSSGKTLIAGVEAMINFLLKYPQGRCKYIEPEWSLDKLYAQRIGLPTDGRIEFINEIRPPEKRIRTIEDLAQEIEITVGQYTKKKIPCLIVVDSLDALSDAKEMMKKLGKKDYPGKPVVLSEFFRRNIGDFYNSKVTLMIISQVRVNVGVIFGKHWTRSGGKALDFYALQAVLLGERTKLIKKVRNEKRAYGVVVEAGIEKNKTYDPYRKCLFTILNQYGADDIGSSLLWLHKVGEKKFLKEIGVGELSEDEEQGECEDEGEGKNKLLIQTYKEARRIEKKNDFEIYAMIKGRVKEVWNEIDREFRPPQPKYGGIK